MANGPRSIYSSKRRMASGQYETPLADFLDRLPDYISGYQQQKLQEKKYNDALTRQTRLDNERKEQALYTNELNLIKMLPENARSAAFATSKNSEIKSLGINLQKKEEAFTDKINSVSTNNPNDPYAITMGLQKMLSEPSIIDNPSYTKKIKDRIDAEKPSVARKEIDNWAKNNPNNPRLNQIMSLSKLDPEKALNLTIPVKTSGFGGNRSVYNPTTGKSGFMTDEEINAAKKTKDQADDVIPLAGAPKIGTKSKLSLRDVNTAIKDIQRVLRRPEDLTKQQLDKLKASLISFEAARKSIINNQSPTNVNNNNANLNDGQVDWENYRDDNSN